jgi:hypothetical protein
VCPLAVVNVIVGRWIAVSHTICAKGRSVKLMPLEPVTIGPRIVRPHKAVHGAQFEMRTVLTTDPFNYVDLWLRRQHKSDALFYWRQARAFYHAAQGLPVEASPLVLYYCFMNAAKALLSAKGVIFDEHHGVRAHRMRAPNGKVVLRNEGIRLLSRGIASALSSYLGETTTVATHSLEDILYNIVCVHRTYCLSYPHKRELFLPLREVDFVRESTTGEVHLRALAVSDIDWGKFRRALPGSFQPLPNNGNGVISAAYVRWATNADPTQAELQDLRTLHGDLRSSLHYINANQTLWYLKTAGTGQIHRMPMTLTLVAMHRLSEICRYRPSDLLSLLNGQKNWLLTEFLLMASSQYLDEIACEMTQHQIMIPNVRAPA